MSPPNERRKSNGRRDTDIPEEIVTELKFRMDAAELMLKEHKDILASVSKSLAQLVLIESDTKTLVEGMSEFREALHGTKDSKGLFTRISDLEGRQKWHGQLWVYVGGSVAAGIVWGIGQIALQVWAKTAG